MKKTGLAVTVVVLLLVMSVIRAAQPAYTPDQAYEKLLTAGGFSASAVGIVATTPAEVEAFRILLGQPGAKERFKQLLQDASRAGKLYALAGLYLTDRKTFDAEVGGFEGSGEPVGTMTGCVVFPTTVGAIVEEIRSGKLPRELDGKPTLFPSEGNEGPPVLPDVPGIPGLPLLSR